MRLFIAVNFDDKTVKRLMDCQRALRRLGNGNFSAPENLHLTLAFLGEVDGRRLDDLKRLMDGITVPRMDLVFSKVGCFRSDDELWWIGAEDNAELARLQKDLTDALLAAGFSPDVKKFRPHITLARRMNIGRTDSSAILREPITTRVSAVSLMLSHRPNGRLTYTELYRKEGCL